MTALEQAIAAAGGQNRLAKALKITRQRVNHWLRLGYVPKTPEAALIRSLYGIDVLLDVEQGNATQSPHKQLQEAQNKPET